MKKNRYNVQKCIQLLIFAISVKHLMKKKIHKKYTKYENRFNSIILLWKSFDPKWKITIKI